MLEVFAAIVNKKYQEVPITLNVSGRIITGRLVAYDRWLEECKSQARNDGSAVLEEMLQWKDSAGEAPLNKFLHLLDGHVLGLEDKNASSKRGAPWRVPVARVSNWFFGEMALLIDRGSWSFGVDVLVPRAGRVRGARSVQ